MPVRNALRHPATDLEPAGAERLSHGDGHIAAGEIQGARRALRHRLRRKRGKPATNALAVCGTAQALFTAPGFYPLPGSAVRAGSHHAVPAFAQHPGDPPGLILRRAAKDPRHVNLNLSHPGVGLQGRNLSLRHLTH